MEEFYGWLRNMICYLCLFHLLLQLLPEGGFRKYIRFFGGILLLLMVIGPLADTAGVAADFEKSWRLEELKEQAAELQRMGESMEELRSDQVERAFEAELKRQAEEVVRAWDGEPEQTDFSFSEERDGVRSVSGIQVLMRLPEEAAEGTVDSVRRELGEIFRVPERQITIRVQE